MLTFYRGFKIDICLQINIHLWGPCPQILNPNTDQFQQFQDEPGAAIILILHDPWNAPISR